MLGNEQLTFAQVNDLDTRSQLVEQVRQFNDFFVSLLDKPTKDDYGIDNTVLRIFTDVVGNDLDNYLAAGITSYLGGRYEGDDVVEDVPFFYPIIGTIRYNLLKNLCNEVIQRARTQS